MGTYYHILGRQVAAHQLSMATLGGTFLLGYLALRGGKKDPSGAKPTPPIQASSSDEETFIKEFLKQAEAEENKKGKAAH